MNGAYANTGVGGVDYLIRYGTGAAPANGVAATGSSTAVENFVSDAQSGNTGAFAMTMLVSGLVVGTAYWFDMHLAAIVGGTAVLGNLNATAFELG
jgi:hypothetical protein